MKRVELYARVRHAVMIDGLSQREAARRFGIDPRTVKKMLSYSVPPGYVPADAPRPEVGGRFRLSALSMRRFGDYVRLARSRHALAVFDACFAGTVFTSQRALPPVAVTRATTLPVRQFVTSGDAGLTVSDDGTFRELFLRALHGEEKADANDDGYPGGPCGL